MLDAVSDSYGWPHVVMHSVFGVLALGFIVVLVLAWYHGERGAQRISGPELLLIALVLAVGGGLLWHFARAPEPRATASAARTTSTHANKPAAPDVAFDPPADSIVVLPFTNLSGDPKQAYFSNGITEELTGALGQNTGLTVIAWATASGFSISKQSPAEIGRALNVAHLLDGSIEHEGPEVRVSVELVNTVTGRQLWSAHYDDSFKNIFAVQDKITAAIAGALKVKFAGMQAASTLNPAAHELYLKGLAAADRFTVTDVQAAQGYFQQALKLDPDYADAWAGLAIADLTLVQISTVPLRDTVLKARAAANKALALDARNTSAWLALGLADENDLRIAQARAEYRHALALDPNNAYVHLYYSAMLPLKHALAEAREAARLNPDSALFQQSLAYLYQDLGDWKDEIAVGRAMIKTSPHDIDAAFYLAFAYTQLRRSRDAVKAFDQVQPTTALDRQLVDTGRLTYRALGKPELRHQALDVLDGLRRAGISPFSRGYLTQLYLALGEKETVMRMLPGLCATGPLYCDDLAVNPLYAPLRGDPRFAKLAKRYTTNTREGHEGNGRN